MRTYAAEWRGLVTRVVADPWNFVECGKQIRTKSLSMSPFYGLCT